MKHLYLLTLTLTFTFTLTLTLTLSAQHKYIPFPDSNAIWMIKFYGEHGEDKGASQTFIQRDTIINGIKYMKLVESIDSNLITRPGSLEDWFAMRNDTMTKKVFIYDKIHGGGGQEKLLYDFSLKVGDTIPKESWNVYRDGVVTAIDTLLIDTNEHLVFHVKRNGDQLLPYVEGIGGLGGLIHRAYFFEGGNKLICQMLGEDRIPYYTTPGEECKLYHYTGREELSKKEPAVKIYPHPLTSASSITLNADHDKIESVVVYDCQGKIVYQKFNIFQEETVLERDFFTNGLFFYLLTTTKGESYRGKLVVGV